MRMYRAILHLFRADYLARVRSSAFFILLALMVFAGYFYTPASSSGYKALYFEPDGSELWYRGVYNSAWLGTQVAIWAAIWLLFTGFFLVRNGVERDRSTGVGQIIATTPLTRLSYVLGKVLSNLVILLTMVGVVVLATGVMQVVRGEDRVINLWQLLSPFLIMVVPIVVLIAALAVLFECITFLRGTVGSVVYFFLALTLLLISAGVDPAKGSSLDPLGISQAMHQMGLAMQAAVPGFKGELNIGISPITVGPKTFVWQGWSWSSALVFGRLFWLAIACVTALAASLFFTRFDPSKEHVAFRRKKRAGEARQIPVQEEVIPMITQVRLTPLSKERNNWWSIEGRVLLGELRLLGKEVPWWWYIGALAWIVLDLFLPYTIAYTYLLPVAWLWPLPIWSSLGNREWRLQTHQLIFASEAVLRRQFFMHYLAAVVLTLFAASGMLVRVLLMGNLTLAMVILLGAFFIPALALCLGVWSKGRRLFEIVYLMLWYIGAINQLPALDFMGVSGTSVALGVPYIFAGLALVLLLIAILGRARQVHV